jgi:hypothetical protein
MATGYVLDGQDLIPGRGKMFLFSIASRLALGPTQPLIQWIRGAGRDSQDMKLTTYLHLVPRSRVVELYLHSPVCVHVMMLI